MFNLKFIKGTRDLEVAMGMRHESPLMPDLPKISENAAIPVTGPSLFVQEDLDNIIQGPGSSYNIKRFEAEKIYPERP